MTSLFRLLIALLLLLKKYSHEESNIDIHCMYKTHMPIYGTRSGLKILFFLKKFIFKFNTHDTTVVNSVISKKFQTVNSFLVFNCSFKKWELAGNIRSEN